VQLNRFSPPGLQVQRRRQAFCICRQLAQLQAAAERRCTACASALRRPDDGACCVEATAVATSTSVPRALPLVPERRQPRSLRLCIIDWRLRRMRTRTIQVLRGCGLGVITCRMPRMRFFNGVRLYRPPPALLPAPPAAAPALPPSLAGAGASSSLLSSARRAIAARVSARRT